MKLKVTYTRRILAKMYFPDCEPQNAVHRLTSEIKRCVELYERKHPTPMTIQLHPQCLLGIQSI